MCSRLIWFCQHGWLECSNSNETAPLTKMWVWVTVSGSLTAPPNLISQDHHESTVTASDVMPQWQEQLSNKWDGVNGAHGTCACVHACIGSRVIYKWRTNVQKAALHSNGDENRRGTHTPDTHRKWDFNCAPAGPRMNRPFVNFTHKQTTTRTFGSLTRPSLSIRGASVAW